MLRRHHLIAFMLGTVITSPAFASSWDNCNSERMTYDMHNSSIQFAEWGIASAQQEEGAALSAFRLAKAAVEAANCDWEGRDKPQCPGLQGDYRAKLDRLLPLQNSANAARARLQDAKTSAANALQALNQCYREKNERDAANQINMFGYVGTGNPGGSGNTTTTAVPPPDPDTQSYGPPRVHYHNLSIEQRSTKKPKNPPGGTASNNPNNKTGGGTHCHNNPITGKPHCGPEKTSSQPYKVTPAAQQDKSKTPKQNAAMLRAQKAVALKQANAQKSAALKPVNAQKAVNKPHKQTVRVQTQKQRVAKVHVRAQKATPRNAAIQRVQHNKKKRDKG
jgi:hypothetical protein